jgi:hypothetical protein
MSGLGPRGVLRVGDRVRFDDTVHTVAGLAGTMVRLVDEVGAASLVLFTHMVGSDGFALLDSVPTAPGLPPFGLLDIVAEPALRRAKFYERHLVEIETGLPPDYPPGSRPRPEYDPKWRTITERIGAKAAELTASGSPVSERTLQRLRVCWREQGVWGLIDRRTTRMSQPYAGGRSDERVIDVAVEVLAGQDKLSTGTRSRVMRQVEVLLAERHGAGVVPVPARSTFYRLLNALAEGKRSFGAAITRRSQARRPRAPFTPTMAARPGEVVQIDTTPLEALAVLDDGVTGRVELTIAVDVASRTICAAVLRPAGTKAVDAALLLARMLVPEPMRPGWADALRMSASLIPHARLMSIDARLEHAAAKPVIVPDTIVIDHGKVFVSQTFTAACRTLGISVQPATGAGHVPVCLSGDDYIELLPVQWRRINDYGSWAPTGANPRASKSKAGSGRSTTILTTCRTSGSAKPGQPGGSPFREPGWDRSRRRSPTSPGAMPAHCWPSAARTTPTSKPSPPRWRTC